MYTIIAAWLSVFPLASAFYAFDPKWPTVGDKLRRESLPVDSYADAQPGSFTLPLRKTHSRRDNQYPIVPANAPKQANSAGIPQDGTDKSYMVEVAIGSQSKKYHLLLDSAASNTWVMGDNCKSEACGLHSTFGSADSATLKVLLFQRVPKPLQRYLIPCLTAIRYRFRNPIRNGLRIWSYRY